MCLLCVEGKLYYTGASKKCPGEKVKRLVLFTTEEQERVLKEAHDDTGAHQGISRTQARVTQDYYWKTICSDVYAWVYTNTYIYIYIGECLCVYLDSFQAYTRPRSTS